MNQIFNSIKKNGKDIISVRAYKGDATTFLAFDLDESLLDTFVGFSIHIEFDNKPGYFLFNRLTFTQKVIDDSHIDVVQKLSSRYSPFQIFHWTHVPSTDHNVNDPYFGDYTYKITPRYIKNGVLEEINNSLTVAVTIDVSPFESKGTKVGFTRAFISSQAYLKRFGMNNQVRPDNGQLEFNITNISNSQFQGFRQYEYSEQHKYLGWQTRARVLEFLDETLADNSLTLDVFAYDLNEPIIVEKLITLAGQGRLRIILDNDGTHGEPTKYEGQFELLFNSKAVAPSAIARGCFGALSHSKIFIQKSANGAKKVLTGSTNFSTNGLYVNANHVLIFNNPVVAQLYEDVFEKSFGQALMDVFNTTDFANNDFVITETNMPDMTIRFSPHKKPVATKFFKTISERILAAESDVLFAIMMDDSQSSILDAVRTQVKRDQIYTYGITDTIEEIKDAAGNKTGNYNVFLYKPESKRGIRIAARGGNTQSVLPPPFENVPKVDGYAIHHKFVVVDFKGNNPVVYCGSSNLAFGPEQRNGDNLLEIRDRDIVTAFAIEALRLVDHYQWRNREFKTTQIDNKPLVLDDLSNSSKIWYKKYYNSNDLRFFERQKFIS